jgi:S1-C subfamily serine protease
LVCAYVGWLGPPVVREDENPVQEIQQNLCPLPRAETRTESVDDTSLKIEEMLHNTVMVKTRAGSGSGTIIERFDTSIDNIFEYRVLTNAHVVYRRLVGRIVGVDIFSGKTKKQIWDTGCQVAVFDPLEEIYEYYKAKVLVEDSMFDLAILSFESEKELAVVKIASEDILSNIRVFDEVFVIGCQYGNNPGPTFGILTEILTKIDGDNIWCVYSGTAQMAPGSSGGGLFKKHEGHYYLIGIPFRVRYDNLTQQIIPHIAQSISMITAQRFLDQYSVSNP